MSSCGAMKLIITITLGSGNNINNINNKHNWKKLNCYQKIGEKFEANTFAGFQAYRKSQFQLDAVLKRKVSSNIILFVSFFCYIVTWEK